MRTCSADHEPFMTGIPQNLKLSRIEKKLVFLLTRGIVGQFDFDYL